jgi:pimeloyl-ACP methyl ester carboxylesterase
MTPWQSGYVVANKLKLHYTRTGGTSKQPLVLAHGVTDDGLCWTALAEALASEYDVIMVDARGHGRSDAPKSGYGPAHHAKDLAGIIKKLKLHRPIILGHSMGAMTTLTFAGIYPKAARAILLEDPPLRWMSQLEETAEISAWRIQTREWMAGLKRKTHKELVAEQHASMPHWSDSEIERWADSKQRFSLNISQVFDAKNDRSIDWQALLPRISCPALLITADPALGGLVTTERAEALQSIIPQLQIEHIAQAGHSIRHDQFDKYLNVVQAFLAGIKSAE